MSHLTFSFFFFNKFHQFLPFFKLTCLVILSDRTIQVIKNWPIETFSVIFKHRGAGEAGVRVIFFTVIFWVDDIA